MIPLFLDLLFKMTVRKNRKEKIKNLAKEKAKETGKSLIIFNDKTHGIVINSTDQSTETFDGDMNKIIDQMANNSCVIIVSETFEYINPDILDKTIKKLKNISGGDFYSINIEKNSSRLLWDYKIKNIMDKSFYLPNEKIVWEKTNNLQKNIQKFYSYVFKIIPYHFFIYDPIEKN